MGFGDLNQVRQCEWMDDPHLAVNLNVSALRDLDRLNRLSRTAQQIWRVIRRRIPDRERATILDVAAGSGSVAAQLSELASSEGKDVSIDACDISETAIAYARANHRSKLRRVFKFDATRDAIPWGYDVIICSLFLHHLNERDAGKLLQKMTEAANIMTVVSDLQRSRTGLVLAYLASRLFTRSPVVRIDALRSVKNAYTICEVENMARKTGLSNVLIARRFPCRFMLVSSRVR
jgi:2-polyprenyl-3-methyl-5-hydroxy-6-metoxy-1,4-benzoquinol methylase